MGIALSTEREASLGLHLLYKRCIRFMPGANQSMFTVYAFDHTQYGSTDYAEDFPAPFVVKDEDSGTTATVGKSLGKTSNDSGQPPGTTTRRDAHVLAGTLDGKYIHVIDRIQNLVEVFDSYEGACRFV
jgi:hypothetical protein